MISADALRRLLYQDTSPQDSTRAGYHYETVYDGPLLNSVSFETTSAVRPSSFYTFSSVVLAASTLSCLTMKARHKEKWWLGMFACTVLYYNAVKAHKVDNGLVGHQCAFFGDALLVIGCGGRMMVRSGIFRRNLFGFGIGCTLSWIDIGRFHLWSDYVTQYRKLVSPQRSLDLLGDFTPQDVEQEFLFFRDAKRKVG